MMIEYIRPPIAQIDTGFDPIPSFVRSDDENIDWKTVDSFGEEWSKFGSFSESEIEKIGHDYFDIMPENVLKNARVLDMGCGSGRWSYFMANKVKFIEAVDPSVSILVAQKMLRKFDNVRLTRASVQTLPFPDNSFDVVISLGVLHHIPDTLAALKTCVNKVRPGGACLIYLYYNLDNRGGLYKLVFRLSNLMRIGINKLPTGIKKFVCDCIAFLVYFPLSRLSLLLVWTGLKSLAVKLPLAYYRDKSKNILRNDSLDRFGTPLEQRFSRKQIQNMMTNCGLTNIIFSENEPYWHAIGFKP